MTISNQIHSARKAELNNFAMLKEQEAIHKLRKKEIYAIRKAGQPTKALFKAWHVTNNEITTQIQAVESKLETIRDLAFDFRRQKQPTKYFLPKGKNRRENSLWMDHFFTMSSQAKAIDASMRKYRAVLKVKESFKGEHQQAEEQLTELFTEYRQLRHRWNEAHNSLRSNQIKKMSKYGPKLVAI